MPLAGNLALLGVGQGDGGSASRTDLKDSIIAPEILLIKMKLGGPRNPPPPRHTHIHTVPLRFITQER